jgi:excisionase family DNA binding protein
MGRRLTGSKPPERIQSAEVARILGVSQRLVQKMAVRCEIPAARVGGVWTFDVAKVRAWIAAVEQDHETVARYDARVKEANARVRSAARALREQRSRDARLWAGSIDEAYERAIGLKPKG